MISYLQGKIIFKKEKFIILGVNGVGYKVFLSQKTFTKIPEKGKELKLFCFMNVRENSMELYGFLGEKELEFFEILEGIRGVGPKAALEIASLGPLENIKKKIEAQDSSLFEGIPGIGKKKAMTIVLELSGKIKDLSPKKKTKEKDEAIDALTNLGFSKQKAKEALAGVSEHIKDTEGRIKSALKILGR